VWVTPEEIARRKKLKKKLLYFSLPFIAVMISALVTILANQV
jgi:hypothetical protein